MRVRNRGCARGSCCGVVRRGCAQDSWHMPSAQAQMVVRAGPPNLSGYDGIDVSASHKLFRLCRFFLIGYF